MVSPQIVAVEWPPKSLALPESPSFSSHSTTAERTRLSRLQLTQVV